MFWQRILLIIFEMQEVLLAENYIEKDFENVQKYNHFYNILSSILFQNILTCLLIKRLKIQNCRLHNCHDIPLKDNLYYQPVFRDHGDVQFSLLLA